MAQRRTCYAYDTDRPPYKYDWQGRRIEKIVQNPPIGSNLPGFSDLLALYGPNPALAPVTLHHVGWRWYQPGIGRFVQRDLAGLSGGLNVYVYCRARPTATADPQGLGVWEWIYTGDWNASDDVYDAAVDAAADWLVNNSWVRGGYAGVGTPWNRGPNASAGVSWTIDSGFNWYVCVTAGWSQRTKDPLTGRYSSGTWGGGYTWSGGEGGPGGGMVVGGGQNQKGHGGYGGAGTNGGLSIGGTGGWIQGGVILDPGIILR